MTAIQEELQSGKGKTEKVLCQTGFQGKVQKQKGFLGERNKKR
jgi:hypothetical protein